jgi:hypothetical protein
MLVEMKMIEAGIAPFNSLYAYGPPEEIGKAIETLSPEEQRRAKRKFRKMWKKAYKELQIDSCAKGVNPGPSEIRRRRQAVYRMFLSGL